MSEGKKPIPVFAYPGGEQVEEISPEATIKWIKPLGGEEIDHLPNIGDPRPDGKPVHGGVQTTGPDGKPLIECHLHE